MNMQGYINARAQHDTLWRLYVDAEHTAAQTETPGARAIAEYHRIRLNAATQRINREFSEERREYRRQQTSVV